VNEASKKSGIRRGLKKLWLLALIALAVLGSSMLLLDLRREPTYKNKPISYWVNGACRAYPTSVADATPTYEFQQEVRKIGQPAIPYLEKKLQTGDFLRRWERRVWDKLPDKLMMRFAEPLSGREIREGAAATLAIFGPRPKVQFHILFNTSARKAMKRGKLRQHLEPSDRMQRRRSQR
jgi:hypothetical protein